MLVVKKSGRPSLILTCNDAQFPLGVTESRKEVHLQLRLRRQRLLQLQVLLLQALKWKQTS